MSVRQQGALTPYILRCNRIDYKSVFVQIKPIKRLSSKCSILQWWLTISIIFLNTISSVTFYLVYIDKFIIKNGAWKNINYFAIIKVHEYTLRGSCKSGMICNSKDYYKGWKYISIEMWWMSKVKANAGKPYLIHIS